ncbi:MAG: platelet-activating factor acetylhydrolase IB subunit [Balneolaceae bacterium]
MENRYWMLIVISLLLAACAHPDAQSPEDQDVSTPLALTPTPLEEEWAIEWWMPRHEAKLEEEGRESARLLFLGDSITQGWEEAGKEVWEEYYTPLGAYNLGFSGDRTENVLWRLEHGEVDGINPELAVLMIGTNNTGHRQDPPQETARGVERILEELGRRLPDTKVLLLAIFPRGATPADSLRQLNNEINERITALADNKRVYFLDINDVFLDEEGGLSEEIMPDLLHPNEQGYELWAEEMEPTLNRLLD